MRPPKLTVAAWPARKNSRINPFQALLSEALEDEGVRVREFHPIAELFRRSDVWHWHWPEGQVGTGGKVESYLRFLMLLALMESSKWRRIPIVWTAHNVHGRLESASNLEARFKRRFGPHLSGLHYLSEASRQDLGRALPDSRGKPYVVTMHGHYGSVIAPLTGSVARDRLGLDQNAFVLAFVGKIEAYKGVERLLDSFEGLSERDVVLVVAGKPDAASQKMLERFAGISRISMISRFLSDAEVSLVLSAADLVVYPFEQITNSGSIFLAISASKPVLVPDIPAMREIADVAGASWVRTYNGPLTSEALQGAVTRRRSEGYLGTVDLSHFEWNDIARKVVALYRSVVDPETDWQSA